MLSVVIPSYNTAEMTLRCVRAIRGADDVIVVDDGSTDDTVALLSREARVISLEKNRGFAVAANRGVAEARGDLILLLNSDAIVEPDALNAFVAAFENDSKLGVAGAQLLNSDGSKQWSGGRTPTLPWIIGVVSGAGHLLRLVRRKRGLESPRHTDWVSGAAMMFRREAWRPLDERYLFYCQDIDFCLNARKAGWDVRIVDEARVTHAHGSTIAPGGELSYDPARMWPDLLTWGRNYYGESWAARARIILIAVAALRIAWRKVRFKDATAIVRGWKALSRRGAAKYR
ncbi:MAG TPA: glycosyltransferase family 2 protein [Thermoanaerobaculia bacterium]|nr:glycosyltransferase family 2 protein [Thermoanaerobaculia bacterium]